MIAANTQSVAAILIVLGVSSYCMSNLTQHFSTYEKKLIWNFFFPAYILPSLYTAIIAVIIHRVSFPGVYEALSFANSFKYIGNLNWVNHQLKTPIGPFVSKFDKPYQIDSNLGELLLHFFVHLALISTILFFSATKKINAMLEEVARMTENHPPNPMATPAPLDIQFLTTVTAQDVVNYFTYQGCDYFYVREGNGIIGIIEKSTLQFAVSKHHKRRLL